MFARNGNLPELIGQSIYRLRPDPDIFFIVNRSGTLYTEAERKE